MIYLLLLVKIIQCIAKSIGNRNFDSTLPITVFQINSINLIESEEFKETSIVIHEVGSSHPDSSELEPPPPGVF